MLIFGARLDIVQKMLTRDMRKSNIILTFKIIRNDDTIILSHEYYILKNLLISLESSPYDANI